MAIQNFELQIDPEEGFIKNDLFGHKAFGDRLINLIENSNRPLSVAIDGQWGEGKTTFLKMWAGDLRSHGYSVIEFDAFANDYYDDPFIPLAGEVVNLANKSANSKKKALLQKATNVALALAKGAAKTGVKAVTLGAIDDKIIEGVKEDIADGLSEYAEKQIANLIDQHQERKSEFSLFRRALSELPQALSERPKNLDGSPITLKPLIFIIDELGFVGIHRWIEM